MNIISFYLNLKTKILDLCVFNKLSWVHFYLSLWASCTLTFRGVLLIVIQLSWYLVWNSKEVDIMREF